LHLDALCTQCKPFFDVHLPLSIKVKMNQIQLFMLSIAVLFSPGVAAQAILDVPGMGKDLNVVITPTRLKQALADVPASVTVITAATIRQYGIRSVPEALRMVPGMSVMQPSGNDFRVNYHGTNVLVPRRMNVLIDGVSVYRAAYARVDWQQLPIAMDDIDRIEVTRGPNSASYGPNSMLAVINIISKNPKDLPRAFASITSGSSSTLNAVGRATGGDEKISWLATVSTEKNKGLDAISRDPQGHDNTSMKRLNLRALTSLTDATTLDVQGAYVEGRVDIPFIDAFQSGYPDKKIQDAVVSAKLTHQFSADHELQFNANYAKSSVQQEWPTCPSTAMFLPKMFALWRTNPAYANAILKGKVPSGGTAVDDALAVDAKAAVARLGTRATQPLCVSANRNFTESRSDFELQDTFLASEKFRLVSGLGARQQRADSQIFFDSTPAKNTQYRAFANLEYKVVPWLHLNLGGYGEKDQLSGYSFSPRVAINTHLSETQTVRMLVSRGNRSPDLLEQRAKWSFYVKDLSSPLNGSSTGRFFQSALAAGDLKSERVTSKEIGYFLNLQPVGLMLDVKVFDDQLTSLISEKLQLSNFAPTNQNSAHLTGLELQTQWALSSSTSAFLNYAVLKNHASTPLERTQYSKHSGAVGVSQSFGNGWQWSAAYYGASGNGEGEGEAFYGREDLNISKTFDWVGGRWRGSFMVSRLDNKTVSYFQDFGRNVDGKYNSRLKAYGQLSVDF
jgi:iron complex outermembrane recepter protein